MGTYTANKNLYMPTVGEQGWGTLMNGNLETIDTFLKPITVSGSTYTFTGNHVGNQSGGTISATSITNSGTLTQTGTSTFTGKITANGGIGTKALTATSISNSGTLTQTGTSTFTGKITANGGVNDYEERITALESGEFTYLSPFTLKVKFTDTDGAWTQQYSIPTKGFASGSMNSPCSATFRLLENRDLPNANNLLYKLYYADEETKVTCTVTAGSVRCDNVVIDGVSYGSRQGSSFTINNFDIFSEHTISFNSATYNAAYINFNYSCYVTSQL